MQSKGLAGSGAKEAVKGNLRRTRNRKVKAILVPELEQERRVASRRMLGPNPRPTVREPSLAAQIGSRGQRALQVLYNLSRSAAQSCVRQSCQRRRHAIATHEVESANNVCTNARIDGTTIRLDEISNNE